MSALDQRLGERRSARLQRATAELLAERRQRVRRADQARRLDNARANHVCSLVYDAYVRGHGAPPQRSIT